MIEDLHKKLVKKEITPKELISDSINKAKEALKEYNAFVTILDEVKENNLTDNLLSNIPYGIKDNITTKGVLTTASSNSLKNYVPIYDATVVKKLKESGAVYIGKTTMDELGLGGEGTTCHTGKVLNPWDKKRMCAGSSSGSATSVACGVYPFALGSDTGDSIRKPAAYCGIVGFKPTYGLVSRYGLFAFASSLDTIGVLTRSVKDASIVIDAIKGKDNNDMTSWDSQNIKLYENLKNDLKGKKLFYIDSLINLDNYENPSEEFIKHIENFNNTLKLMKKLGAEVSKESIDEKLLQSINSTYIILSCAEATSNLSNLTGISFGPRSEGETFEEMVKNYRTQGFSPLIKRRLVIGSYVLQEENQEKYFINAKRVRRLIVEKFNSLFEKYDAFIMPVSTGVAKYFDSKLNKNDSPILEELLQIGNFGGYPSITIPNGFINGLPTGVNITGKVKDDSNVLNIAYSLEQNMTYENQIAKESKK